MGRLNRVLTRLGLRFQQFWEELFLCAAFRGAAKSSDHVWVLFGKQMAGPPIVAQGHQPECALARCGGAGLVGRVCGVKRIDSRHHLFVQLATFHHKQTRYLASLYRCQSHRLVLCFYLTAHLTKLLCLVLIPQSHLLESTLPTYLPFVYKSAFATEDADRT